MAPAKQGPSGNRELLLPIAAALLLLLLGAALLVWPDETIHIFPPLIGVVLVLAGIPPVVTGLVLRHRVMEPGFRVLQGCINIGVGIIFIVKQDLSLMFLSVLFGLYALVSAGVDFSEALRGRRLHQPWLGRLVESVLRFLFSILLLFSPFGHLQYSLWARLLGIYFFLTALGLLRWLLPLRRHRPEDN